MTDQDLILPPAPVVELEVSIRAAICQHLATLGLDLPTRQLEFLCAPWAHFFTHSAMHRLELGGGASPQPRAAQTGPLPHAVRAVPGDTLAFMEFFRTPPYRKYLDATLAGQDGEFTGRTAVYVFAEHLPARARTVTFISCLPRKFRYLLQLFSLGRIRDLENKPASLDVAADWAARQALADRVYEALLPRFPQAAAWLSARVQELFPKSLLENLPASFSQKLALPARQTLFSADGWQIIDDWKIYALAQKVRHQAHWIGSPNAVGHGSLAVFWQREFEIGHLDTYLTWGWSRPSGTHAKVVPFYCPNFAGQRGSAPARTDPAHGVLISSAARPQHLLEYPYTPDRFERYLGTQLNLADAVQKMTRGPVSIRTRPRDLGWDLRQMVQSLGNPGVTLEFQQGKFTERLRRSWLHICDNCSTTIVESLWANHPTLILISEDYFQIAPGAREEFALLASVGIFHQDKESLLNQVSRLNDRLDSWWRAPATQSAVMAFLSRQGRGGGGLRSWKRALLANAPDRLNSA